MHALGGQLTIDVSTVDRTAVTRDESRYETQITHT